MRRTKIICTLGPNTSSEKSIENLIKAGMNIARLNFSHGNHDFYRSLINRIRAISSRLRKPIAILQDLQGPKIRTGQMNNGAIYLNDGKTTTITTKSILGTSECFSTQYPNLPNDVRKNDIILLNDGKLTIKCLSKTNTNILCKILHGGILENNKGMNIPRRSLSTPSLTKKDIIDVYFGANIGVDAVALSFVRSAEDIRSLKKELSFSKTYPLILAKLEKEQAIKKQDEILEESDGVMVARGDLGVEMPPEEVPAIQKEVIINSNNRGKLVIVATQMLESMISSPIPTRAEASDVANATLDGADILMLSGETANGDFPIESVKIMNRIILQIEKSDLSRYWRAPMELSTKSTQKQQNAIALAAVRAAEEVKCSAIAIFTTSGATAWLVANCRPKVPIFAFVTGISEQRRLSFVWGVQTEVIKSPTSLENLWRQIQNRLIKMYDFKNNQTIVLLSKFPFAPHQRTNALHIHTINTLS